jgi:hypothetical protein
MAALEFTRPSDEDLKGVVFIAVKDRVFDEERLGSARVWLLFEMTMEVSMPRP